MRPCGPGLRRREVVSLRRYDLMSAEEQEKDWKLKLRYGRIQTPFHHFTVLAE